MATTLIPCARRFAWLCCLLPCLVVAQTGGAGAGPAPAVLRVHAAGSLRAALVESAAAFEAAQPGVKVQLTFGASGLLKDRLLAGEASDVFASANMAHPQALAQAGRAGAVQRFARNAMCALARPGLAVDAQNVVAVLLDPAVKLGTSTPGADPAGDYAWQLFDRIEASGVAGAAKRLAGKALQLTGGPNSPPPPAERSAYGALMAQGAADVFLTYCTNAIVAAREVPGLQVLQLPAAIAVSTSYGLTVLQGAPASAQRFVDFLLAPAGQAVLLRHGFAPA
jgi:ABC-type molybdate transport system substrate-binding protein